MFNLHAVSTLLIRYWWEYKQVWRMLILRDVLDRLLFLFAFGYGFGAIVKQMDSVSYLAFLAPGIACSSPMMTMTMAGTFGTYERINSSKVWQSWLATPIKLHEILFTELLYASLRSMPSVFILLGLAWGLEALPNPAAIPLACLVLFLANFAYGAVAMCFTAHINRTLYFAYVNTLWMTPMYLFSGVFFDLSQTPPAMQAFAQIYPLHHVIEIIRPLLLGREVNLEAALMSAGALILIFTLAFTYALHHMHKRIAN